MWADFLAKGGKITKCPTARPDVEPIRQGQYHALKDRQDLRHGRDYRGKGEV